MAIRTRFPVFVLLWLVCAAGPLAAADQPRVLLIGDSIAGGYTPTVIRGLQGKAVVVKNPGNGGPTAKALAKPRPAKKPSKYTDAAGERPDPTAFATSMDYYLAHGPFDLIHFNWGLHDLANGGIPQERYLANLEQLVDRLQATGAILVFATTTPVPEKNKHKRIPAKVVAFNEAAVALMQRKGVHVNDLYAATLPRQAELQLPDDVHFGKPGYAFLGKQVVEAITAALAASEPEAEKAGK